MWSDITPAVETDYKKTRFTFSNREATDIYEVFVFPEYINYNTPTHAISDLYNHLALVLGDYKSDIARVGVL